MSPHARHLLVWSLLLGLDLLLLVRAPQGLNARPLIQTTVPVAPATPPGRVLLVVIDGLRADTAHTLPGLSSLAREGASATLVDRGPTFSAAQYVSLLTGVPPRESGVRNNQGLRPVGLDSVPARVRATQRRTAEVGDEVDWWRRLFGKAFDEAEVAFPGKLPTRAAAMLEADFVLVHLVGVDHAGHQFGGASSEYAQAASAADATTMALVAQARAQGMAVVIASDHGHTDHGGHGGDEPEVQQTWLVMAGPGVKAGATLASTSAIDVAPTLAALLGVPAPGSALGHTLVDLLDLTPATRDRLVAADATRVATLEAGIQAMGKLAQPALMLQRAVRAGALALFLFVMISLLSPGRAALGPGLRLGVVALALTVGVVLLLGLSFSSARDTPGVALRLSSAGVLGAALVGWWQGRIIDRAFAEKARDVALLVPGVLVGAAFVWFGPTGLRLDCEPASLAIAPLAVFAAYLAFPLLGWIWAVAALRQPAGPR